MAEWPMRQNTLGDTVKASHSSWSHLAAAVGVFIQIAAPVTVLADGAPQAGSQFTVLDSVPDVPLNGYQFVVARSASGPFMFAWPQRVEPWPAYSAPFQWFAQTFNADGTLASSAAFQIAIINETTRTTAAAVAPAVAMDQAGNVAAVWYEDHSITAQNNLGQIVGSYSGTIHAQRYTLAGASTGSELNVASTSPWLLTSKGPGALKVAMDDWDNLTVAWTNIGLTPLTYSFNLLSGFSPASGIVWSTTYTKSYSPSGAVKQAATAIDGTLPTYSAHLASANVNDMVDFANNGSGNFVAIFQGSSYMNVYARLFNSKSRAVGNKFALPLGVDVYVPVQTAIDAQGNFAIAYYSAGQSGTLVQRYAADGSLLSTPIGPFDSSGTSTLLMEPSGAFVLVSDTLMTVDIPGLGTGLVTCEKHVQYFNSDGTTNGSELVIDDGSTQLDVCQTEAAIDASGNLVMVWPIQRQDLSQAMVARLITAP